MTNNASRNIGRFVQDQLTAWEVLFKELFHLDVDTTSIKILESQAGFDRLIVIPKELTLCQIFTACAQQFKCCPYMYGGTTCGCRGQQNCCPYIYETGDQSEETNDRINITAYAIWVRGGARADRELDGFSADQLKEKGIPCTTLMEHLLFELKYFSETGKHLDYSLCCGTRYPKFSDEYGDYISFVDWNSGSPNALFIGAIPANDSRNFQRSRAVIA